MPINTLEEFGEFLKSLRNRIKLSQNKLAAVIGVDKSLISKYEDGTRTPPIEKLEKLANALQLEGEERRRFYLLAGTKSCEIEQWTRIQSEIENELLKLHGDNQDAYLSELERFIADRRTESGSINKIESCIIPVAGWQSRWLPHEFTARLVEIAMIEAINVGIVHAVVVVAQSQKDNLQKQIRKHPGMRVTLCTQSPHHGLGQAVLDASSQLSKQRPFAILLPDERFTTSDCLKSLCDIYLSTQSCVFAVRKTQENDSLCYGIIRKFQRSANKLIVERIEEKPGDTGKNSDHTVLGRYVLSPNVFTELANITINQSTNTLELTDALNRIIEKSQPVYAVPFAGREITIKPAQIQFIAGFKEFVKDL